MSSKPLAVLILILAVSTPSWADDDVEVYDYVVEKGDTCIRIAKKELGSRSAYKLIHKYNPGMGKTPHRLKAGRVLKLPRKKTTPDAHVTDKRGSVRVRKPAAPSWFRADKGMALFRSWRVNAQSRASAELTFADESSINLRENTVVIVYGPSRSKSRQKRAYASLEKGTLRARLGEFDGKKSVIVETPGSQAEIASGSAIVSVDDEGTSRVANHKGKSVKVRSRGRKSKSVSVAVGMGSKVKRNRAPEKPRPLPPTPGWTTGPVNVVGFSATGGTLRGKWKSVAEATTYRVEIAIDPIARAVVSSVVVPSSVSEFEAKGLPPGDYYVSVSSIDNDKFESVPSKRVKMTIHEAKLGGAANGKPGSALTLVEGTVLSVAGGVTCGQGNTPASERIVVAKGAPVRCFRNGGELPLQAISVVPVKAELASTGALAREKTTMIEISLESGGLKAPELTVSGTNVEIESVARDGETLRVAARPKADAGETALLELKPAGAPSVVLASVKLAIEARVEKKAPVPRPVITPAQRPLWSLGVFAAIATSDREFAQAGGVDPGLMYGGRIGRRLGDRFALELFGSFSTTELRNQSTDVDVFSARFDGRFDLIAGTQARLHVLAGPAGVFARGPTDENELGVFYGSGVRLRVNRGTELRLEARHLILGAQGGSGVAHQLEASLGASLLF